MIGSRRALTVVTARGRARRDCLERKCAMPMERSVDTDTEIDPCKGFAKPVDVIGAATETSVFLRHENKMKSQYLRVVHFP